MTIGIPQALLYWKQPYFWESFFEELGFKVLLSPSTNREIIEKGVKVSDPENCFSMKVFFGHILWLDEKCDWIFVPRLKTNQEKLEYCPKFFGAPDLAKILVKTPILTETFDYRKKSLRETLEKLGKELGRGEKEIGKAEDQAFLKEKEIEEKQKEEFFKKIQSKKPKIVLISHPYNLEDEYVNLRMKEKLKKLGAEPIFIDEVPTSKIQNSKCNHSPFPMGWVAPPLNKGGGKTQNWPKFHWEFGKEIMEKIQEILNYNITGVIEISSFACGCDAVIKEFVEKEFKRNKIPFLYLIIDEHTGEAGFQTRLEAFLDTI